MRLRYFLAAALVISSLPPRASVAGMITPCSAPSMFGDAAVTVFVFPYVDHTSVDTAKAESEVGTDLAGLIQADTLLAISRFGNVAAIRLLGTPQQCQPSRILPDLILGFGSGANRQSGVVLMWGRIFRMNDNIYVQSYASFQRFKLDDPGEMLQLPFGGSTLVGRLATQTVAFAPRHVSQADLEQIKTRYAQSNIVHEQPDENSPGKPLVLMFPNERRPAYYLTETRGNWIHIQAQSGQSGWLLARAVVGDELLSSRLPELKFVEGVAGYFSLRNRPATVTAAAAEGPLLAFENGSSGAAAEAMAVSKELRGLIRLLAEKQSSAAFEAASGLFSEAATTLPSSAAAGNLAAVATLYRDWRQTDSKIDFQAAAGRFWASVASDPTEQMTLTNCWTLFEVARSPQFKARFTFPEDVGDAELQAKADAFKAMEVAGRPLQLAHVTPVVPWPAP